MSRRKYTIRREAGLHLTDRQREMLGTAWNGYVNRCARISLRHFARVHNIPYSTWQRELRRLKEFLLTHPLYKSPDMRNGAPKHAASSPQLSPNPRSFV